MFTSELTYNVSDGDLASTTIGNFTSGFGNNISGVLFNAGDESDAATVTVTLVAGGFTYVLPELDLSDINAQVPFSFPLFPGDTISYSAAVTGSTGIYQMAFVLSVGANFNVSFPNPNGVTLLTAG